MDSTTLICKRCKAPLEYEEGSAILKCPHCGYSEKIDESDPVTIERIRAKLIRDTELGKKEIEKNAAIEEQRLNIEEKNINLKKIKIIIASALFVCVAILIVFGGYKIKYSDKIKMPQAATDYCQRNYEVTYHLLKDRGFENIEYIVQEDLSMNEQRLDGIVTQVSINGDTDFGAGEWFSKTSAVKITYRTLNPIKKNDVEIPVSSTYCLGKGWEAIRVLFENAGFENIGYIVLKDLSLKESEHIGIVTEISVGGRASFSAGMWMSKTAQVMITYHVLDPGREDDVEMPVSSNYCIGRNYQEVRYVLSSSGFQNIQEEVCADLGKEQLVNDKVITRITVDGKDTFSQGDYYAVDVPIIIIYHTIDPDRKNDIEVPGNWESYIGRNCTDVRKEFQKAGFSNITLVPKYDLKLFGGAKSGEIQIIAIKGSNTFVKGTWVPDTTNVTITYHAEESKFIGKNYQDVENSLKEMGFTTRLSPLNDLNPRELKKDGNVESVTIRGNDFSSATELNLLDTVTISYHSEKVASNSQVKVTSASKELVGKDYLEVVEELRNMGFTNVTSLASGDLLNEWFTKAGTVKSITIGDAKSFDEGDIFDKDAAVVVSYHSLKNS